MRFTYIIVPFCAEIVQSSRVRFSNIMMMMMMMVVATTRRWTNDDAGDRHQTDQLTTGSPSCRCLVDSIIQSSG